MVRLKSALSFSFIIMTILFVAFFFDFLKLLFRSVLESFGVVDPLWQGLWLVIIIGIILTLIAVFLGKNAFRVIKDSIGG